MKLQGPQFRSEYFGEKILSLLGIGPRFLGLDNHSLVTISSTTPRFLYVLQNDIRFYSPTKQFFFQYLLVQDNTCNDAFSIKM